MLSRTTERLRNSVVDKSLLLLLAVHVAGLAYVGLTPFSFSPPNRVQPLTDRPGLAFDATGLATSRGEFRGSEQFPDRTLSIHLRIEPDDEPHTGLGTILSVEDNDTLPPLIVAQWKSWLVVRARDPDRTGRGYWEIDAAGFRVGETRFVTITSGPTRGTTIYVDGVATGDTRRRAIIGDDEPFDGRLLLGCLGNGSAGWRGKLSGLAITSAVLDPAEVAAQHALVHTRGFAALRDTRELVALYDFTNSHEFRDLETEPSELLHSVPNRVANSDLGRIEIPTAFAPLRPGVLALPRLRDMKADWFLRDLLRNVAGFIPLGFLFCVIRLRGGAGSGRSVILQTMLLSAVLSLGIESVQITLPMRTSSLSDLSLNIVGAAIGAAMGLGFRHTALGGAAR